MPDPSNSLPGALRTDRTAVQAVPEEPLPAVLTQLLPPELLRRCEPLQLARGERLFHAGQRPTQMHYVLQGEVLLQRSDRDGGCRVLQRSRQGFVAEASLEAPRYHCDALATAPTRLLRLPLDALRAALRDDGAFALRWIALLNQEMRRLRLHCERLGLGTVQARLWHLIDSEGQAGELPLGSGLKNLAGQLGVSHEALYRCVADLERQGRLERRSDPPRLCRIDGH